MSFTIKDTTIQLTTDEYMHEIYDLLISKGLTANIMKPKTFRVRDETVHYCCHSQKSTVVQFSPLTLTEKVRSDLYETFGVDFHDLDYDYSEKIEFTDNEDAEYFIEILEKWGFKEEKM